MTIETIILIITNIIVPIIVALITGSMQAKKYKKEIRLINAEHENRIKELNNEHAHEMEVLNMQIKHQQELEVQRAGNEIIGKLADRVSDTIMSQPATQKMIAQKTAQRFSGKKRR